MCDLFFPPIEGQKTNHCGPASLSMCLGILGIEADQRKIARAAGKPYRIYAPGDAGGLNEHDLKKAASRFGARTRFLSKTEKSQGKSFLAGVKLHLDQGNPLLLLVWDFGHWIAVIGRDKGRFVIFDPDDEERNFSFWSDRTLLANAWNENDSEDGEPDQYFAILASRKDGKPARYDMSGAFLGLCEKGSEDSADSMFDDLVEMAERASQGRKSGSKGRLLGDCLARHKDVIVGSVWHWIGSDEVEKDDLDDLYDDYVTVASATGIRLPSDADTTELVAQVTTLLTTYAWTGEL